MAARAIRPKSRRIATGSAIAPRNAERASVRAAARSRGGRMSIWPSSLLRVLRVLALALALFAPPADAASLTYLTEWAIDPVSLSAVGPLPLRVLVVHPSGARGYGETSDGRIGVLDTLTNTVIATVTGL